MSNNPVMSKLKNPKWKKIVDFVPANGGRKIDDNEYRGPAIHRGGENPTSVKWSYNENTGKISVKDFAQDSSAEEILRPLGMKPSDLYPPQEMTRELKAEIAAKQAAKKKQEAEERLSRAHTAVALDLANEFDPGTTTTDRANAARFLKQHSHIARYAAEMSLGYSPKSWFIFDGKRWARDATDQVYRLADGVRQAYDFLAAEEVDPERRPALRKVASSLESKARVENMIQTASKFLPITLDTFDRDPWLLNVENGTIDLRTGNKLPHDPEQFITKLAPVEYDPEADAPLWRQFLGEIFNENQDLIDFVQRSVGYALTGSTKEQVVFFLYGTGRNGKSTLVNVLQALLGDYAMHTPTSTLMSKRNEGVPNDVARLKGARFVSGVEVERGRRLSEPFIKQLSGGDIITARFMRAEWFEFLPQFKLFFAVNHKPVIRGTDLAVWRRIRLIPFDVTIPEEDVDPDLGQKLLEELPGILNWALKGCLVWQQHGLGLPAEVAQATAGYREEMDLLSDFFEEYCVLDPLAQVSKGELYVVYKQWAESAGERVLSTTKFGSEMIERGFEEYRTGGTRYWEAIGLKSDRSVSSKREKGKVVDL